MRVPRLSFIALYIVMIGSVLGCVPSYSSYQIGNPLLLTVQPEDFKGKTKAEMIEMFGQPNSTSIAYTDGQTKHSYTWVYIGGSAGDSSTPKTTTLTVSYNEAGEMIGVSNYVPTVPTGSTK